MTEQQQHIMTLVRNSGGSIHWGYMIDDVPYEHRQKALADVRELERVGELKRVVAPDAETGAMTLTIELVGA